MPLAINRSHSSRTAYIQLSINGRPSGLNTYIVPITRIMHSRNNSLSEKPASKEMASQEGIWLQCNFDIHVLWKATSLSLPQGLQANLQPSTLTGPFG